jgi:hypothetical protein
LGGIVANFFFCYWLFIDCRPNKNNFSTQMGCPALGIWVGFLKQPALPGEAPQKKNSSKKILKNKNH